MFHNLKKKWYRFKARWTLINRYEYLIEVDNILEEYLTSKLLRGGSSEFINKGRAELSEKQAAIKEQQNMVDFLKSL